MDLFGWGTHYFDMLFFYNDETPVDWVIGQIDARGGRRGRGHFSEGQGISYFKYRNGVYGLLVTGSEAGWEASNRLVGTDGVIEVGHSREVPLRRWDVGQAGWQVVEFENDPHWADPVEQGVLDLVEALKAGREPELSSRKALRATELIFATYESSRRRGRVELPLDIEDSPFLSMLESGEMSGEFPPMQW